MGVQILMHHFSTRKIKSLVDRKVAVIHIKTIKQFLFNETNDMLPTIYHAYLIYRLSLSIHDEKYIAEYDVGDTYANYNASTRLNAGMWSVTVLLKSVWNGHYSLTKYIFKKIEQWIDINKNYSW